MRWRIGLGALLAALAVLGLFADEVGALAAFPSMPSAYEAKEMCSCLFVEERDELFCSQYVRQDVLPIQERIVDAEARTVTVRALGRTVTAGWLSPADGCGYVEPG